MYHIKKTTIQSTTIIQERPNKYEGKQEHEASFSWYNMKAAKGRGVIKKVLVRERQRRPASE